MMKELQLKKLIIDVNESNEMTRAVLQYNVLENGIVSKIKSVGVTGGLTAEEVNSIIADAKESAETSEGV